ncbi:MAG: phosphotransferase [SAR86 cluster bacterium]|nr:phosphotransferase [SAR86 cluster bacterium]
MNQDKLKNITNKLGYVATEIEALKLEASGREYYRLHLNNKESLVLCYLDPALGSHNKFVRLSEFLQRENIPSPKIISYDPEVGVTVQQDLGDEALIDIDMSKEANLDVLDDAISILPKLQQAMIPQLSSLDSSLLSNQMDMMKEFFLDRFLKISLESELDDLRDEALEKLEDQPWMNCHFDFERRNLHYNKDKQLCVIDFQDLTHGPIGIDLAGIFIDHYYPIHKKEILNKLDLYNKISNLDVSSLDTYEWLRWGGIQRGMRILGTLPYIYFNSGRSYRLKDLPQILDNFIEILPNHYASLKSELRNNVKPEMVNRINKL